MPQRRFRWRLRAGPLILVYHRVTTDGNGATPCLLLPAVLAGQGRRPDGLAVCLRYGDAFEGPRR